jgi:cyclopropane fatty-acyl-phospholipid synthase-like methyltransferase
MTKSDLIKTWTQNGLVIRSHYQQKISSDGINSAKSLGERTETKNFLFPSLLFEAVCLSSEISILDIGCGKAELLSFLTNSYPEVQIKRYLGLDLVEEFLDLAQSNYPEYEFQQVNFISEQFLPSQPFDLVVALGVLVSRVQNYTEFAEYFINKMVQCSSSQVLFNLISQVDLASANYSNYQQLGRSTFFPQATLKSILDKIENINYRLVEKQIFPDATDLFVQLKIR